MSIAKRERKNYWDFYYKKKIIINLPIVFFLKINQYPKNCLIFWAALSANGCRLCFKFSFS